MFLSTLSSLSSYIKLFVFPKFILLFLVSLHLYDVDYLECLALLVCLSNIHSSFKAHSKDYLPCEVFLDSLSNSYSLFVYGLGTLCTWYPIDAWYIRVHEMKAWVHLFSHVAWLWDLPNTFLLWSHSILEPLFFPAVPSEAWYVYPRNLSWLIKLSITTANIGNCYQIFHFRDAFDDEFVWNSYKLHPNCIPRQLFDSMLKIYWVCSYPESVKNILIHFVYFLFGAASYTLTEFQCGEE